jgi:hypothetical protein
MQALQALGTDQTARTRASVVGYADQGSDGGEHTATVFVVRPSLIALILAQATTSPNAERGPTPPPAAASVDS